MTILFSLYDDTVNTYQYISSMIRLSNHVHRDEEGDASASLLCNKMNRSGTGNYHPWRHAINSARNSLRNTFPIKDLGKLSRNSRILGTLYAVNLCSQNWSKSRLVFSDALIPGFSTTNAATVSPRYASGTPTTATSATAGCWNNISSTSRGYTLKPLAMMTSLIRSRMEK